jgi:hypothetical protein
MRRVDGYMKASVCSIDLSNNVPYNVFRHGYLEARSRVPVGKGAWSAFWLGSEYHARNWEWPHLPALSGRDRHPRDAQQRAAHAIHDAAPQCERQVWSPRRDASGDALDALRHRHDALQSQTEFHVYAVKWTPDRVPWFREGKSCRARATTPPSPTCRRSTRPISRAFIVLNTWPCGSGANCPDSTSPDVLDHQFDWV